LSRILYFINHQSDKKAILFLNQSIDYRSNIVLSKGDSIILVLNHILVTSQALRKPFDSVEDASGNRDTSSMTYDG